MAKARARTKVKKPSVDYKRFVGSAVFGGVIAWAFSGNLALAFVVFVAVWVGNWVVDSMSKSK
ncbi:MAG TPA: hypothetical protein VE090_02885 [Methylomirabilota bacterium]|nr:hypothetical protein [Methylomirabilota bacterium]